MSFSYDVFTNAFLEKITEYDFSCMLDTVRTEIVDDYMRRAISNFKHVCVYDFMTTADDDARVFSVDVKDEDCYELVDIVSEGMVCQWLKPFLYRQEVLENTMNTRDFSVYSPAELLLRIGNAYRRANKDYTQMIREYSYNHSDLSRLHL